MELSVIQKNGVLRLNHKNPLRVVTKAEHKQLLLSEDVLNISVESKKPINFYLGDKIEYAGRYFKLNFAPVVKREQGFYTYDLVFEGSQYDLRKKVYFNLDKTGFQTTADFPLTGEMDIFLRTLITNMNSLNEERWVLGEFPENTDTKTLTFAGENCLAVLQRICQEYDAEFEIKEDIQQGVCTLNIKKIGEVLPYVFEYGKGNGLYALSRNNEANDVVTRLYAYGSSDNIPNEYRGYSERLRMPENQGDYIQDEEKVKLYGLKEGVKNFEEIKPSFKGVITRIGAFDERTKTQELEVLNMDFDLNERDNKGNTKYLINDTPVKLHFNKGNLAGYDFELIKSGGYNHATKVFKLKQFEDPRGQKFPDPSTSAFVFQVGDEFTLLDIVMPEIYITNAEQKLLEEARKEYEKQSRNNVKYTLNIDPFFLKNKGDKYSVFFRIGDFIRLKDEELGVDKQSRIISLTRNLLDPFSYSLDIADTFEISFTVGVLNDIKDTKRLVKNQIQINRENYYKGIRNLTELKENIFDTDGYFDAQNIKPQSIETNMLSVGAKSQQFALEDITLDPNVNANPNSISITAGKLVHFSLEDKVREWTMLPYQQSGLLGIAYYVYAKVERNGAVGRWLITTEKIKFDQDSRHYHFLCYLLYTPKNGKRDAEALYGNVMMHGGQITAGRIKSLNGQTYFDLDTGEISGRINFTNDSPALTQVQGLINDINVGGRNLLRNTSFKNNAEHWYKGSPSAEFSVAERSAKVVHSLNTYNEILQVVPCEPNTEYCVSAKIKGNGTAHFYIVEKKGNGNTNVYKDNFRSFSLTNKYQSINFTIRTQPDADNFYAIFRVMEKNKSVYFKDLKIEKGNKPTDWTPAPEDVEQSARAYADAQDALRKVEANAYADGIVDAEEQRAIADATAKMEVAKVHAQSLVNDIQVGGRNLMLNSKKVFNVFHFPIYTTTPLEVGADYTFSVDVLGDVSGYVFFNNSLVLHYNKEGNPNEWRRISVSFKFIKKDYNNREIYPHIYGATSLRNPKLEKGNKATDWTPAPEDVEAQITTAQNTANQALGLTQAQTANITALQQKTNFLSSTAISGNAVATGTLIVGNNLGANAGITGLGGNSDVFLWGGAGFSGKDKAPISITRDGKLIIRHPNGNVGFEIGIFNGFLTLNGYHEEGFKLFEIDPNRGFVNVGWILESWKPVQVVYLGYTPSFKNFVKIKVERSGGGYDDPVAIDKWAYLYSNKTIYDYQNGTRPDKEQYAKYVGYKAETGRREEQYNAPEGWYIFDKVGEELANWAAERGQTTTIELTLHYIQNGKIKETKKVRETF